MRKGLLVLRALFHSHCEERSDVAILCSLLQCDILRLLR